MQLLGLNKRLIKLMYFGINIPNANQHIDWQDIGARLFLSPRMSCDHVSRILEMLSSGNLSVDKFNEMTNGNIDELRLHRDTGEDITSVMNNKRSEWEKAFNKIDKDDYKYLADKYSFSQADLFGKESIFANIRSAKEMASIVKERIIGQDSAIDRISVPFFQHMKSIKNRIISRIKSPVFLIGSSGVGKSQTCKEFARLCDDCPVIFINSSEIVPTGWRGLHISDILARSINNGLSIEDLRNAIIVFQEFDKIIHYGLKKMSDASADMDVDLIRDIMCLFESEYSLHIENGFDKEMNPKSYELPVDNLMLVFDGVFYGMEDIIRKRLNIGKTIGFNQAQKNTDETNILSLVKTEDFITWGYTPELMGRIGECVVLNPLTSDNIYQIMTRAKDNILSDHICFCQNYHVDLKFTDDALYLIADMAYKSGLGFRNVRTLLSKCLNDIYFELGDNFESGDNVQTISIDRDYVAKQLKLKEL